MGEPCASSDGSVRWGREGPVIVFCSAAQEWSDAAWQEMLDGSLAIEQQNGGPATLVLAYFVAGNPTATQRRMSADATQKSRLADRVALVTESVVIRGAFTAIQWILGKTTANKAFSPGDVRKAIAWLAEAQPVDVDATYRLARQLIRAAHFQAGTRAPAA